MFEGQENIDVCVWYNVSLQTQQLN